MAERSTGNEEVDERDVQMNHRTITLADGRYMIFYTFGDEGRSPEPEDQEKETDV